MTAPNTAANPLEAAIASVSEFPERLGPVLIKELRQGLRSGLFVLPFVVLPAALALVAVWALSIDNIANARNGVESCFWIALIVPVLFLTPLRALVAIRSEREARTLELLQLTPLTAWRIVLAKWSSLQAQSLLWVAALLPFLVLRYFFGAMNLADQLLVLLWVVVAGAVLTAFGLVVSTLPRVAFWLALTGIVFLGLLGLWSLVIALFSGGGFYRYLAFSRGGPSAAAHVLLLLVIAHTGYLALAFAAAQIAPPAENHAVRLRGGTLGLFAWFTLAPVLLPAPDQQARWPILAVAIVAAALFAIVELATERTPLLAHVRPFARLGAAGRFLAAAFLPGWPSALVCFSAMTVLFGAIVVWSHSGRSVEQGTLVALFWLAVVLPRAVQGLLRSERAARPALHLVLHLSGPLVAGVIAMFSFALGQGQLLPALLFPSSLWWLLAFESIRFGPLVTPVVIGTALWVTILVTLFFRHSRPYWTEVGRQLEIARSSAREVPSAAPANHS